MITQMTQNDTNCFHKQTLPTQFDTNISFLFNRETHI